MSRFKFEFDLQSFRTAPAGAKQVVSELPPGTWFYQPEHNRVGLRLRDEPKFPNKHMLFYADMIHLSGKDFVDEDQVFPVGAHIVLNNKVMTLPDSDARQRFISAKVAVGLFDQDKLLLSTEWMSYWVCLQTGRYHDHWMMDLNALNCAFQEVKIVAAE